MQVKSENGRGRSWRAIAAKLRDNVHNFLAALMDEMGWDRL